jgi:hypothetical protein
MDSNTHSTLPADGPAELATLVDTLAAQDLTRLPDATLAERVLKLRCLLDRLEGHWLEELAGVDARGAAGAEHDLQAGSSDGGCVFPACDRPLAWCEAHHVWHWVDGGPTDLDNLVLLCRAHHRAVHEGGWQLTRQPDGRLTTTPPHRQHPHRLHPAA